MLNEYSQMLLDSAKEVYKVINKPKYTNENKMIIAAANTLAQTAKTAIQVELVQYRASMTAGNTSQLIHKVNE
jgi:hypothetical protein